MSCGESVTDDAEDAARDDDVSGSDDCDAEGKGEGSVVMALYTEASRVGCAMYRKAECLIETFELAAELDPVACVHVDVEAEDGWPMGRLGQVPSSLLWLKQLIDLYHPLVLLPQGGGGCAGLDVVTSVVYLAAPHGDVLRMTAETAFDARQAIPRLRHMYPGQSEAELVSRFASGHHHHRRAMLGALAALLHYTSALQCNICDVVERGPLSVLYLDAASAQSLQLTRCERHPCDYQGIGRTKEGLSLFTVVNHTVSSSGRALLLRWFALPSCDLAELQRRQRVVAYFTEVRHHEAMQQLRAAMHRVRPVARLFTLLRCGKMTLRHYQTLLRTLRAVCAVYDLAAPLAHEVELLHIFVHSCAVQPLRAVAALLQQSVHNVQNKRARRPGMDETAVAVGEQGQQGVYGPLLYEDSNTHISINAEADPTGVLDELRAHLDELGSSLRVKAEEAFQALSPSLRRQLCLRCLYVNPHGYLLCTDVDCLAGVEAELRQTMRGQVSDEERDWPAATYTHPVSPSLYAESAGHYDEQENSGRGSCRDGSSGSLSSSACNAVPRRGAAAGDEWRAHSAHGAAADSARPSWCRVANALATGCGWELHYEEGGLCYFKTAQMRELDAYVGDLRQRIYLREDQLRRELDEKLLYHLLYILQPSRVLAELDCLLGFAHCALRFEWCQPELLAGTRPHLDIRDGWHPVLGSALVRRDELRPFCFSVRQPAERVSVFVGANGSGKSVLLGAVAQMVFLAHLGACVPAAAMRLSLVRSLWSVSAVSVGGEGGSTSSFHSECAMLGRLLRCCCRAKAPVTPAAAMPDEEASVPDEPCSAVPTDGCPALILLDEFGRGTTPEDGAALLTATLRRLALGDVTENERRSDGVAAQEGPIVLCATHLIEMFELPEWPGQLAASSFCGRLTVGFPFNALRIFDMRCTPLYVTAPCDKDWVTSSASPRTAQTAGTTLFDRELTDIVPTYQPYLVTRHAGHHAEDYQLYRNFAVEAVALLVQRAGLPDDLLVCWSDTVRVVQGEKGAREDRSVSLQQAL